MNSKKIMMALSFALGAFLPSEAAKLTFHITEPTPNVKVMLTLLKTNEQKMVTIDAAGNGTIELNDFEPQYALLQYTRGRRTIYLHPDLDMTISFTGKSMWTKTDFSGEGGAINTYLADKRIRSLGRPEMLVSENVIMHKADSLYAANCQLLENAKLPSYFSEMEKERLKFRTYFYYALYGQLHGYDAGQPDYRPSDAYMQKLKGLAQVDAELLGLKEYRDFLTEAFKSLSRKEGVEEDNMLIAAANYVDLHVKDPKVAEYLINEYAYNLVYMNGLDHADSMIALFKKYVKDAKLIATFNELCGKWEKLKPGTPSVDFIYPDINGKNVSLSDLKGKFVYIDVWATWCGPCRGELPALTKLEEEFAGKDVHFVSMSCDKSKKAWEGMVKAKGLKGIQLHMGTDETVMKAYNINGIPRFILLDRDGKIITANMSRPSDPKTAEMLHTLLTK